MISQTALHALGLYIGVGEQDRMNIDRKPDLNREIPLLTAQIRALYSELDRKFGLQAARVPITFGYEEDILGSYTQKDSGDEHFHFSLLFAGYSLPQPLKPEDRKDLYLHEYAHYMQFNMEIPKEYTFAPGIHGSAWKYCCSLIGAAPSPYYKVGEGLQKHDYEKVLRNAIGDRNVTVKDQYRREKNYQNQKNRRVQFEIGEEVVHPKFGKGVIESITPQATGVRLSIRFGERIRKIDQKWLLKSQYH